MAGGFVVASTGALRAMTEEERVMQAQMRLDALTQHLMLMPRFPSADTDIDTLKSRLVSEYKVRL